jgi:23S rRNA (cytosine1962-C5)-methyltransferase
MSNPVVPLKPGRDKRLRAGHPWVFSNEIASPVAELPPGGTVEVTDHRGAFLGRGYANPNSLIAVRILTRNKREEIDHHGFFAHRLRQALAYRSAVQPGRLSLRLVHAEGDGLPGLVVDRYGEVLSVQITTLGMEVRRELVEQALRDVLAPAGAVLRNDGRARTLEGLPLDKGVWFGSVPEAVAIEEHGVRFEVHPLAGQKTGHFYDQAENRRFAATLCAGRAVLDVYSHNGAWALHALRGGATRAVTVDRAEEACAQAERNGVLNGVSDRLVVLQAEGKQALEQLAASGQRFGAVVVDPPAFAKTRKAVPAALKGYRDVNALAMRLLEPGGLLFASSCSYHVQEDRFEEAVHEAARHTGRRLRLVRRGEQAPDHPVVPGIPETRYLKSLALYTELDA